MKNGGTPGPLLGLGLWQVGRQSTVLPESAGLEQLDAFTALQDTALGADGTGCFEAAMLRHNWKKERLGVQRGWA